MQPGTVQKDPIELVFGGLREPEGHLFAGVQSGSEPRHKAAAEALLVLSRHNCRVAPSVNVCCPGLDDCRYLRVLRRCGIHEAQNGFFEKGGGTVGPPCCDLTLDDML